MTPKQALKRLDALDDLAMAAFDADLDQANLELLRLDIINTLDETRLAALEAADTAQKVAKDAVKYKKDREDKYKDIEHLFIEALVEKESGDSTKWDEFVSLRDAIKTAYPKP